MEDAWEAEEVTADEAIVYDRFADGYEQIAASTVERPHIVISIDPTTATRVHAGPYPTAAEAAQGAAAWAAEQNADLAPGDPSWRFVITPLFPPNDHQNMPRT